MEAEKIEKPERLLSLDIFRGLTIAGMILVNNPGSWGHIYPPLRHAQWHGCTPTDWIFPFFLFIVGVAITLSLTKRKERGDDQRQLSLQIVRRTLIIFVLGLVLAGFPFFDLATIRIPGVLQRIAVVYFFAGILFLKTSLKVQASLATLFLFVYWGLMTLVPVPGVGHPNLEPTTNLAAWLDNFLLPGHLWRYTKVWDPEGILSTLPAVSTCLYGVLLGHWLASKTTQGNKVLGMLASGVVGILLGLLWSQVFPLNKSLWTSSYVLYTAGLALIFFGMCYWLADMKGYKLWAMPFVVYGSNAITVFFLSGLVARLLGIIKVSNSLGESVSLHNYWYNALYTSWLTPVNASLAWALTNVLVWLGLMWILYAKKIFIKI